MKNQRLVPGIAIVVAIGAAAWAVPPLHRLVPVWRLEYPQLHSALEAAIALAALGAGCLISSARYRPYRPELVVAGSGLLGMGILDGFHSLAVPGGGFVLLRSFAALAGGLGFLLAWIPALGATTARRRAFLAAFVALPLALGISSLAFRSVFPTMTREGRFTPAAVGLNVIAGLLFAAGALRLFLDHRRAQSYVDLLFFFVALLNALAGFVFPFSRLWSDTWWAWHALRLGATLFLVGFLALEHWDSVTQLSGELLKRERAEKALRRVNRTLKTLSDCNQSIIRARDEEALYSAVCGEIVAAGGYRMAWVGLAEDGDGRPVRPAASAGFDDSYLSVVKASWADDERGREPAGTAIRTKAPVVVPRIEDEPKSAPWRAEALARGYASAMATPLIREGAALGAFAIYSAEPDAFGGEEVALMNELAGDITYGVGALRAATERKSAEDALRKSEERFSAFANNMPAGMFIKDEQDRVLFVNPYLAKLFGWLDWEGKTTFDLLPREAAEQMVAGDRKALAEGLHVTTETVVDAAGAVRTFETHKFPVPVEGKHLLVGGIALEITERKRAEEALREARDHLQSLIDHVNAPIIVWNPDRRISLFNRAFERMTGYQAAEVVGMNLDVLFPPSSREESLDRIANTSRGEYWEYVEIPILRKDGSVRAVLWNSANIHAADGRTLQATIAQGQDVTERAHLEEQLRQAQKMEAVGRLAGGVAHDFNNLLTAILGYARFALDGVREGDPLRRDIEEIQKAGNRAAALTRQLLAFSRKQVLKPEVLDLNKVSRGIESMLRRLIGEDIDLLHVLAADLGLVKADPGQIEQVIMNLVINARDAMPKGGKLTIGTANVELDEQYATSRGEVKPGPYVMLSVTDTGCGMEERTKARIFEPFFTTKEKGKGTGLGLSTVYGIIKQSDGHVWVYSELGKGTTFKIYLPRELSGAAPGPRVEVTPARVGGTETILVVEDEEAVRGLAERILEAAGYTVLTAANGGEALLTCEQHEGEIHLVLTDVVMPQMSGRALGGRLAAVRPGLKVLYMSGYTDDAIVHHGVLDPGVQFIGKPFRVADLTRKVREVLDSPKGR